MSLISGRNREVDTQLRRMHEDLAALAVGIGETTSLVDPCGHTYRAAEKAADAVAHLRYLLAVSEARWEIAEKRNCAFQPSERDSS